MAGELDLDAALTAGKDRHPTGGAITALEHITIGREDGPAGAVLPTRRAHHGDISAAASAIAVKYPAKMSATAPLIVSRSYLIAAPLCKFRPGCAAMGWSVLWRQYRLHG